MTILRKADLTQAEKTIIDNFDAFQNRPEQEAAKTKAAREAAMAVFRQNGLPSRRMESWHYTDLRKQLTHVAPYDDGKAGVSLAAPLVPGSIVLGVVNGKAVSAAQPVDASFRPLGGLLASGRADLLQNFSAADIGVQINTAFVSDGWKMDIPENASFDSIIELQNIRNGAWSHVRFPVTVGRNAKMMVIQRQIGNGEGSFLSSVSNLDITDGAQVSWIIIREQGISSTEIHRLAARLGRNAGLRLYIINAGSHLLRQDIHVDLDGSGADFQLRGINLLSGKTHADTTMTVRHLVEATTSMEIIRNVVTDAARGVFQGMIRVAQAAQKTDARMACNSLILSDKAEFYSKPGLEIFADDVACGHGATVTEIDHDHLFYLMARGIPEAQARTMLAKAFVGELITEIDREEVEHVLQAVLDRWMQIHI